MTARTGLFVLLVFLLGCPGGDEKKALELIRRLDESRARLIRNHFHADIADPERYDVVFNTAEVGVRAVAASIVELLRSRVASEAGAPSS